MRMDGFGGRRRQWHMKPLPVGPQYILYTSPTQYIYCIEIQIQKNNRTVYSVIHLQNLQKVPHCAVALWWNAKWSQCNVHENQYEYKLCSRVLWISISFFVKGWRVLQDIIPVSDVPEKVKRREPYIKMQIKLLLYNSHCVSTTVSSTWNVRWHGTSKRPQHLYLRVPCHESRPRKVFVMYRWRSGYSKWCRVKIYEVGKAHLGIVHRIVFDPSRPLRKARNPTLITMSTSSGGVKRVGDRTCVCV